jgi:hypothetical protein
MTATTFRQLGRFLSLDGPAEQPDELVTDVDDAAQEYLRSLAR